MDAGTVWLELARAELMLALGALLVVMPLAAYFLARIQPQILWSDLVLFPIFINRRISYLPYPDLLPNPGAAVFGTRRGT